MCGIVGVLRLDTAVQEETVRTGADALAHRGPDGWGSWLGRGTRSGAGIGLGHRRLSILDLSLNGAEPLLRDQAGLAAPVQLGIVRAPRYAMVYNGEIYNHPSLASELRASGDSFRSTCDSEVLLAAYARWGADCVAHLNGMYAFAVWDAEREELFLARDRFGEKPLHYAIDPAGRWFAFASEVKALVAMGFASAALDERAVYRYFRFGEQAGAEQTIWRGVRRLMPANALTVRAAGDSLAIDIRTYWQPGAEQGRDVTDSDAIDEFRSLFIDSVRLRLRSDVPVGTSLSGGLDSSSVLCAVKQLGATSGQFAFTARMLDEPSLDEGAYVETVLRATGVPGFSISPTADLFLDEIDRVFYHQEEPFPSTSLFASYLVHRLAREHGTVVLLDGQGADEYLAGYAHYPAILLVEMARRGHAAAWWRERAALRAHRNADPVPMRAAAYHWLTERRGRTKRAHVDSAPMDVGFLAPDLANHFSGEVGRVAPNMGSALKTRLHADLMLGHLQELLRYTDRNSMAFGREVRLPFLDHRLVDLSLALSDRQLLRNGESKWVLRRAMTGLVPQSTLDRRDKMGFETPWARWWNSPARPKLAERLDDSARELSDIVAPGALRPASREALGVIALASAQCQLRQLATRTA